MFKDDYRKQFENIAPSPALEQETLDLMAEAQAHGFIPPAPKSKKPLILSLSLSGAAAMVAITVGLSFWLGGPRDLMPDEVGSLDSIIGGSSAGNASGKEENDSAAPPADDTAKGENAPTDGATGNDAGYDAGAPLNPDNDMPEDQNATGGAPEAGENAAPAPAPVSPVGPVTVKDKNTETYLSIQAYLDALTAKKAIGFNKNYMADPSLVIVPSWLPQNVQFRHLHAKSNGAYSYSYLLTDGENQYFLDVSAPATFPRTLRDLNLRIRGVKGEYEGMDKLENKRIYYFGIYEEITLTLTTVNGAAPTLEETDRLLADLQLDRYTPQNTLVQLEYNS